MRNLVEKQLAWLALLITAFYSLLASCRGDECSSEGLARCARPLKRINSNDLPLVAKKEDLQQLCPDLRADMTCIRTYTLKCMKEKQREHFNSLYAGTNQAIMELCQDGPYQEEFLRHAPCMQKVKDEYELCYKRYQETTQAIEKMNRTAGAQGTLKSLCCAFQEYLDCSHHTVRRKCGDDTARFTKEFLDRMTNSFLKMHCGRYTHDECMAGVNGVSSFHAKTLLPASLILLGRYFT